MLLLTQLAAAQYSPPKEPIPPPPADLVIQNARVMTPDGWKSAMAISAGAIVAVGSQDDVAEHLATDTRVLDAKGATVLPGLHDMHVHALGAGLTEYSCKIPHGSPPESILDIVEACADEAEAGEWITGRAFESESFGDTPPHRSMLDEAAPDNPVVLTDISGHTNWANSEALEIAGVTRDTPDPDGGIIERDTQGEPTGLLRESAAALVGRHVPPPSRQRNAEALVWALEEMLAQGITTYTDAGVSLANAVAYADLADQGVLKHRVRGCLNVRDERLISLRAYFTRDRFSPSCVKIVLDGVPTDGHTAAMLDNYMPLPGGRSDEGREKGLLLIPTEELVAMVKRFDAMGMTIKFHAAGDAAVRQALDAIEATRAAHGFTGPLHDVGHNSFVHMDDIRRARGLAATFEFSPYIWYPNPIIGDIRRAIGEQRMKRWIPVKDALDAGALSVPGSDWSVVPSVNPWLALETLVTRQVPGGGGEVLGAQERISLQQAFDMYTMASARHMNMAHLTGSIEAGKRADLVIVDQNIFEVPITRVHETRVLHTFIDGEEVYSAR
jgi:hypothetical protein